MSDIPADRYDLAFKKKETKMITAIVQYQVATYSGTVEVTFFEEIENDEIIARAKKIVHGKSGGHWPVGYEHWKVISRNYEVR